jgi:hypothetical protein
MTFRRSYSDPFRRDVPAACRGLDPVSSALGANNTQMQADQDNYQAQVARNNQQVALWNAQRALQQGQVQEDQQRQKTAQAIGSQRAALASQGGDINSGSDLDVVGDTARTGAFNALTARSNAAANAYKYQLDATSDAGQANLFGTRASNAWTTYNNSLLASDVNTAGNALLVPGV